MCPFMAEVDMGFGHYACHMGLRIGFGAYQSNGGY